MLQILSKMFEFFKSKTKRLQDKIDKYIELENDRSVLKSQIDELADFFYERKTVRDSIVKLETDQEVIKSVEDRFDNFVSSHIVEIGDLKRRRDKIDQEMNNLIKGDEEFLNLVKSEKYNRQYKSILSKYRDGILSLESCDKLLKAVQDRNTNDNIQKSSILGEYGDQAIKTIKEALKKKKSNKVKYADNLVFNEKGQLLLLKRSEVVDFKPGHYTIPGGHVDPGEAFETAAKRELLEEAGIKSENVIEVGDYENEDVCIHYFRSDVINVEPLLQEEEIWSYEWVDPKELDKYLMMENMRDNINKILYPFKHQVNKINKSFESGLINDKQRDMLLSNVIEKAKQSFKNDKTEDDISVDKFFENKFEDKYKVFYEAVKKYLWDKWGIKSKKDFDDKFSDEAKLKEVDIDDICPTQKYVSKKILEEKMENDHFKSSNIQILKYGDEYLLYDGHHRTCALIEEGYDTVKDEVLNLKKIKDFDKDIEEYLPKDFDLYDIFGKSIIFDLNKALDDNLISESQYNILLEKAWKKQQIGTVVTHKDGKKYRKVSETGNRDQDWQLVSKDKTRTAKPESNRNSEAKQQEGVDNKDSKENLQESAKNASETALNNAIQHSSDPEVRTTAHEELDRREKEEKPKEEKEDKNSGVNDKEKKQGSNDLETYKSKIKDKYVEVTKKLMNTIDYSSEEFKELSNKQKYISKYLQNISDFDDSKDLDKESKFLNSFLDIKEGETKDVFGDGNLLKLNITPLDENTIVVKSLVEDGIINRTFNKELKSLSAELFLLSPLLEKGNGKGTSIFFNQINKYKELGFKKIFTLAAAGDGFNGHYTWARFGYDINHNGLGELDQDQFINLMNKNKRKEKTLKDLMSTKNGRDFWKKYGFDFNGVFDLSDSSDSMKIFKNYTNDRK